MVRNFRELKVWQAAHEFTLAVYKQTKSFPKDELYTLTAQLRRAALSVESNIAEGCGRRSDPELARLLRIAMGSATESECQLLVAHDLGYLPKAPHDQLQQRLNTVKRMLHALLERVQPSRNAQTLAAAI